MYASPPTSPTSRRRRTSSTASSTQATPLYSPLVRRDSQYSVGSRRSSRVYSGDGSLRNQSSTSINGYFGSSILGNGGTEQENLADELAGAMDEDEGVDESVEGTMADQPDGSFTPLKSPPLSPIKVDIDRTRDSGIEVNSSHTDQKTEPRSPKHARRPSKSKHSKTHSRTHSRKESRIDRRETPANTPAVEEIPAALQQRITEVESLARQGSNSDNAIEEVEDTVGPFVASLRDLGGQQSSLESYATRLITAHTSLSMHLAHQSRILQSLTHYILAPLPAHADFSGEDDEGELIALLVAATDSIPKPAFEARSGLHRLYKSSAELNSCLSSLSDSLHMSRQVTSTATRRLKSAKELVAEMRKELQANEEGIKWIEDGQWEAKLKRRECASACKDVVGGFEEVCNDWRSKLEQGAATGLRVA